MKSEKLIEIIREVKARPKLLRKVKIFLLVGVVGIVISGSLLIWAGISALNYVASRTTEIVQSPLAQEKIESIKAEAQGLPKIKALSCWGKVQSLMDVQPWLERPAIDNLVSLKGACLESPMKECTGADCQT